MTDPIVPKEKPAKLEVNGVVRPKAGTQTARIWEIADALSAAAGAPIGRAEVLAKAKEEGLNEATAATQYGRWTKYYGVKPAPKVKAEKAPKEPKPKKEKAPKAAKAEAAAPAEAPQAEQAAAPLADTTAV